MKKFVITLRFCLLSCSIFLQSCSKNYCLDSKNYCLDSMSNCLDSMVICLDSMDKCLEVIWIPIAGTLMCATYPLMVAEEIASRNQPPLIYEENMNKQHPYLIGKRFTTITDFQLDYRTYLISYDVCNTLCIQENLNENVIDKKFIVPINTEFVIDEISWENSTEYGKFLCSYENKRVIASMYFEDRVCKVDVTNLFKLQNNVFNPKNNYIIEVEYS